MSAKLKMRRDTYRYIESEIRMFNETAREYKRRRSELLTDQHQPDEAQSSSKPNTVSSPTERYAIRLVDDRRLARLQNVMEAIEDVYERSSDDHKKFIEMNYWQKPRARTIEGIAVELNVSVRTIYRLRNEIVYSVAKLMGLY